jgi:phosphatidylinositol 4-kinase B
VYHRVWRVVSEESIVLNTKERVPCIILLEVVDYEHDKHHGDDTKADKSGDDDNQDDNTALEPWDSRRSKEKRSIELPKLGLPKMAGSLLREHSTSSNPPSLTATPAASLQFSLPYYTMMGGMTEIEIVNHWRFAKRDAHRGESILDKVTSSLPLDVHRMKEKINHLRDKQGAIFHDLLSFHASSHSPEESIHHSVKAAFSEQNEGGPYRNKSDPHDLSLARDGDSDIEAVLGNESYENTKIRPVSAESGDEAAGAVRDLSPERNHVSDSISLGQWSSPTAQDKPTVSVLGGPVKTKYPAPKDKVMLYGSTYDGREGRGQGDAKSSRPPRSTTRSANGANSGGMTRKSRGIGPPQQVVFQENWQAKEERLRKTSAFGSHSGWRVLPILVKANDDLRQEQLASQLIQRMAFILARERVPVWLCPYEIIAITDRGGIVECVPDTISLDSLKRNDPYFVDLNTFFHSFFGDSVEDLADAKSNFVESLAAYSVVTFLLQIKDRHNGNILLDNRGHLIHIDFGFFFLSSPGKNTGFESAPFKLTTDFVAVMGGPESHTYRIFRELCVRSFIVLRRHCMEIILLVEMLKAGNEDLPCFRGRPDDAIKGLRERFRLDLSDRACKEYVHSLIDESLENWRTNWYDRYQRYCVGVL